MVLFGLSDSHYLQNDRFEGYERFNGFEGILFVEIHL